MMKAKIEIYSSNIEVDYNLPILGIPQHMLIVCTNSNAKQIILRGGAAYTGITNS